MQENIFEANKNYTCELPPLKPEKVLEQQIENNKSIPEEKTQESSGIIFIPFYFKTSIAHNEEHKEEIQNQVQINISYKANDNLIQQKENDEENDFQQNKLNQQNEEAIEYPSFSNFVFLNRIWNFLNLMKFFLILQFLTKCLIQMTMNQTK